MLFRSTKGVDAHGFDTGLRSPTELAAEQFDRVFISLHGRYGEDGTIQGLLELLNLPYTGSGVLASALAIDKIATKQIWISNGLSTPDFEELSANSDWNRVVQKLGLPLIVKPAHEGSTLGLTKVKTVDELPAAYALAAKFDKAVMAEQFISGMELTCPVMGHGDSARALPVVRIVAPDANYDYQNKYFSDETQYLCPSKLPPEQEKHIQELVLQSFKTLGCRGWARADVMVRESDNQPFLLEINTSPGMTSHSLVPMSAAAAGMPYEKLCVEILRMAALDLQESKDWKPAS